MSEEVPADLAQLRREIDVVDSELVQILARRQKLVEQVVIIKERDNLPAFIPARVEQVLGNVSTQAEAVGLSPQLARTLWKAMIDWFIELEDAHLKKASRAD